MRYNLKWAQFFVCIKIGLFSTHTILFKKIYIYCQIRKCESNVFIEILKSHCIKIQFL